MNKLMEAVGKFFNQRLKEKYPFEFPLGRTI